MPVSHSASTQPVQNLAQHMAHAADQLQLHGFDRYYNAMVGAYVSDLYRTLSYNTFARATNRAKNPLTSLEQAVAYSTLYAKSHFDRFYEVITHIMGDHHRTEPVTKTINLVDYGCGQAIASLALISYLENHVNCENVTLNFYLIEPSRTTLDLAVLLVSKMSARISANVVIHQSHNSLQNFLEGAEVLAAADCSVHLFSNVLDIAEVQLQIPSLCQYLHSIDGKQMVIAVGPQYSSNYQGLQQLKDSLDDDVTVKQDINNFSIETEIYSVTRNHWQRERAYGVMMGLCFKNTLAVSESPLAA